VSTAWSALRSAIEPAAGVVEARDRGEPVIAAHGQDSHLRDSLGRSRRAGSG
jgi:hypothetical protein